MTLRCFPRPSEIERGRSTVPQVLPNPLFSRPMRALLIAVAAGYLPGGHDLSTDYGRARTLTTTSELELDLKTTQFEMTVDGQPSEDQRGGGGSSSSLVRKCVLVDQVLGG